jgi:arylsulfatase A-like enzyme
MGSATSSSLHAILLLGSVLSCGGGPERDALPAPPVGVVRLALVGPDGAERSLTPQRAGEELRSGFVLDPGEVHSANFQVPEGAELRLAITRAAGKSRRGEGPRRPELALRLFEGDVLVAEQEYQLPGTRAAPTWIPVGVALATHAGARLRLELELAGEADGPQALVASPRIERRVSDAPTVVLITSDTHRADHMGSAGAQGVGVDTPQLDRLAARGVTFEDCFASINVTLPSHASILTALPVRDTGVITNSMGLADEATTLAEVFAAEGWYTLAVVSAQHMRHELSGLGQGFDRMRGPLRTSDLTAAVSVPRFEEWLAAEDGVPVFAWLHLFDAHAPYTPPEELRLRYVDPDRDPTDPPDQVLPEDVSLPWAAGVRDLAYVVGQYMSEVTYLDDQLGAVLDHPRVRAGVVAFTSDHGEVLGNHDLYFKHEGIYPDTLAVPLLLAWPGAPQGSRVQAPVSNLDVGRTLLDLAGYPAAEFPGRNLLTWLEEDAPTPGPRFAMCASATAAAIADGGHLLILSLRDQQTPPRVAHQVELYDLRSDPGCNSDLVDVQPALAKALRAALIDWLADGHGRLTTGSQAHLPGVAQELANLGYAEGQDVEVGPRWYEPDPRSAWCRRFED